MGRLWRDRGEVGGSKERGKSASNKLTFLDNGSNKCHSIIFKLVKKPKILSLPLFFLLFLFSFSYIWVPIIHRKDKLSLLMSDHRYM